MKQFRKFDMFMNGSSKFRAKRSEAGKGFILKIENQKKVKRFYFVINKSGKFSKRLTGVRKP